MCSGMNDPSEQSQHSHIGIEAWSMQDPLSCLSVVAYLISFHDSANLVVNGERHDSRCGAALGRCDLLPFLIIPPGRSGP
jgi:hypothetical protein